MTKKSYKITILGCGGSIGVPSIEGGWEDCDSNDIRNYRTRTSAFLEIFETGKSDSHNILFDVSPDFRVQALRENIKKIDNILFTHAHADHILGIDEIRSINRIMQKGIVAYAEKTTSELIKAAFSYVFAPHPENLRDIFYKPVINLNNIKYYNEFNLINGSLVFPTKQIHGRIETTGFVIDNKIAYATDFLNLPRETIEKYKDLDLIIISAFTMRNHISHMKLTDVLELLKYLNPKKAILTHMGGSMNYKTLERDLPLNVIPAYDGLKIEL